MTTFEQIKSQITFTTGPQQAACPTCGKTFTVRVGGFQRGNDMLRFRPVKGSCRHCGHSYTYIWRG